MQNKIPNTDPFEEPDYWEDPEEGDDEIIIGYHCLECLEQFDLKDSHNGIRCPRCQGLSLEAIYF